jgi:hydrogenase maturation protease
VIRVIGIGNPDRGDDGAGRAVARRLRARKPCGLEVRECGGEATELMASWEGAERVVVVDACRGAGAAGSVHVLDGDDAERLRTLQTVSSHSFGVAAAVGLGRALDRLPSRLLIYAIEGRDFRVGGGLTPEVGRAVDRVVALLVQDRIVGTPPPRPTQGET